LPPTFSVAAALKLFGCVVMDMVISRFLHPEYFRGQLGPRLIRAQTRSGSGKFNFAK
jgi:hypothetical protein